MFGFSKKRNIPCPVDEQMRLWMENAFLWLAEQFGEQNILTKRTLCPIPQDFPVSYDGSFESLQQTAAIVAAQMDIDINEVSLDIYEQGIQELGGNLGYRIFTTKDNTSKETDAAGLYWGKNEEGKYEVAVERKNLKTPINLVAVLAHEFAHIKLSGENRTETNSELLTDMTTVIFGLGIFNANSSFLFHQGFDSWGYNSIGYLKQQEWGYALALYAYYRQEHNPAWTKYLTGNIKSDYKNGSLYIEQNRDNIFIENEPGDGVSEKEN